MKPRPILATVLLMAATAAAQSTPGRVEQTFHNDGSVKMDLEAGDYEVRAGASDKVVIRYITRTPEQLKRVDVRINATGRYAKVIISNAPHNDFHAIIEVPPHTGLTIRLSAGDLDVNGIEGDKDIESHAGDLEIDVVRAEQYGSVDAAVKAGDLSAPAFQVSKGGLFRSFRWNGPGKYRLHASLGAGDLKLRTGASPGKRLD